MPPTVSFSFLVYNARGLQLGRELRVLEDSFDFYLVLKHISQHAAQVGSALLYNRCGHK